MQRVKTVSDVADLVRAARIARGWSQQQAANAAGVSRRFVNMVEGGHATAEVGRVLALLASLGIRLTGTLPVADLAVAESDATDAALPGEINLNAFLSTFHTPQGPL